MTARVDAHHHCWRLSRGDYDWLAAPAPALDPLRRDFEPADLEPMRAQFGITQTVVVQAAATTAETDHLLGLAAGHPWMSGVVGWVDLADAASQATLERWAANPVFKAVRPMLQDLPDADWITQAPQPAVVATLERLGLSFDALVKPPHLPALLEFAQRHPGLPIVIDHGAKPPMRPGGPDPQWRAHIAALARLPRVCCKVSGLLTEIDGAAALTLQQQFDAVRPVWLHLLDCFGPRRLMWGSDWPVLNLAGGYGRWISICERLFAELSPADRAGVWSRNAAAHYRLPDPAA